MTGAIAGASAGVQAGVVVAAAVTVATIATGVAVGLQPSSIGNFCPNITDYDIYPGRLDIYFQSVRPFHTKRRE